MIDSNDKATADLIGDIPKRRGRPFTGKAKTSAERMRLARAKAFLNGDEKTDPTTLLFERLATAHRLGHKITFEAIVSELRSRLDPDSMRKRLNSSQ